MAQVSEELSRWHDWTDPNYFAPNRGGEGRLIPLFLRQLLPTRRQRTKLTLTGWFLITISMGIGIAAYNTGSNILFMTLSLLLSSLVLSGILSWINFRGLSWQLKAPRHVRAGEVAMSEVRVRNGKSVFPTMCIRFRVNHCEQVKPASLPLNQELFAGGRTRLEWTFVPRNRGICVVQISGVESQFPFGFLRKTIGAATEERLLVWPGRVEYNFNTRGGGPKQRSDTARSKMGFGSDLLNLRPYQRGDPPRMIHWKATARTGQLVVRQCAQEGMSGYHLFFDPSGTADNPEQFERLCSLAGSLAEDLFHMGRLETVQVAGHASVRVKGIRELHDFFDDLARIEMGASVASASPPEASFNVIGFRGEKGHQIGIFIDNERAGQTIG